MFKKYLHKRLANGPDMNALITAALPPGERLIAWTVGPHCASAGTDNSGIADGAVLSDLALTGDLKLSTIVGRARNAVDRRRHTGGEPGTDARRIPVDKPNPYHLLTDRHYLLLDFGLADFSPEPTVAFEVDRDRIATIARDGAPAKGIVRTRITFTDDSFADYDLWVDPTGANEGFWTS